MPKKGRKHKQTNFSLQDEPMSQPPRVMTSEDHPRRTHAQFDMPNHLDIVMANKGQKDKQTNCRLQDELILQPPRVMTSEDHPHSAYSAHAQFNMPNYGDTIMASQGQKHKQSNFSLQDELILQPPRVMTSEGNSRSVHSQFHMPNHQDTIMANKGQKHKQTNFSLQDEPILQPPGVMTFEDLLRSAHAQFEMPNRWDTMISTRTQVGRRIYNGCVDNQQVPSAGTHLSQSDAMETQPNDRPSEEPRIENELMSGSYEQAPEQGSDSDCEITEKATRGPTFMESIWCRAADKPRYHVKYNDFGQPIGGECSKLTHFLGSIARNGKYCPLDFISWHHMPPEKKTEMLDVVKLRFEVSSAAQKWILRSISHKWRNWKNQLKANYWADNVPVERLMNKKIDNRVSLDQWVKLLIHWNTEKAKEESQRNKDARGKKIMNQRTGKTSFAQVGAKMMKKLGRPPKRFELFGACYIPANGDARATVSSKYLAMQQLSNELPGGSNSKDPIGKNDEYAQIMGQDGSGHVRMMGLGVCPSDIWGVVPRNTFNVLSIEHQSGIEHSEPSLPVQQRCASQGGCGQHTSVFNSLSNHATTTLPLQDGAYVSLNSLFDPTKIVAKGCIHSTNPSTEVGGQILGPKWCEVNVKVILEPEEQLIRPYDNLQKIADTLGEMIAWPCNLVKTSQD